MTTEEKEAHERQLDALVNAFDGVGWQRVPGGWFVLGYSTSSGSPRFGVFIPYPKED